MCWAVSHLLSEVQAANLAESQYLKIDSRVWAWYSRAMKGMDKRTELVLLSRTSCGKREDIVAEKRMNEACKRSLCYEQEKGRNVHNRGCKQGRPEDHLIVGPLQFAPSPLLPPSCLPLPIEEQ